MNMGEWNAALRAVAARNPGRILQDMATYYQRVQQDEGLPLSLVHLVLVGGTRLNGWVAGVGTPGGTGREMVLLSLPEYPDSDHGAYPLNHLAFIEADAIQVITVQQAPALLPVLTEHQVVPAAAGRAAPTNPWTKTLAALPPRLIRSVLHDMAALRREAAHDAAREIPGIQIILRHGDTVNGWVVAVEQAHDDDFLVLHSATEEWSPTAQNISYLCVRDIAALVVYRADLLLDRLSGGRLAAPVGSDVPSKMDIRRVLSQQSELLTQKAGFALRLEVAWETLSQDEMERFSIYNTALLTIQIADILLADELGREALRAVPQIVLTRGQRFTVVAGDGSLIITLGDHFPAIHELRQAIERAV